MNEMFLKRRAVALWNDGQEAHLSGKIELAVECYSKSLDLFPTAAAHTFRGWAFSILKRWDEAIQECKMAIQIDPTFGNPYNDMGSYLLIQGRFDDAIEWLEKAKVAPRYEPRHFPYMNLGRIYAAKGMLWRAIEEFETALKIRPGEPHCLAALADLKSKLAD